MTRLSTFTLVLAYVAFAGAYFADDGTALYLFAAGCLSVALSFIAYITND